MSKKTANDDDFYRGFAVAVGTLARSGWPNQAVDIMDSNGVTLKQLEDAGVEEFDLRPLRDEWKQTREWRQGR